MKLSDWIAPLALALLTLTAPLAASATTVRPASLGELTRDADLIVRARVLSHVASEEGPRRWIYTSTQLEVLDVWKGKAQPPSLLTVRQLGGTLAQREMVVEGNARLTDGEEVVVFLDQDPLHPERHYIVGMAQGKWSISYAGPEPSVARDSDGRGAAPAHADLAHLDAPVAPTRASLADFKKLVLTLLSAP